MRLRLSLFALAGFAASMSLPAPTHAEPVRAVVELFTSQGCSSCPPADALVGEMSRQPGVIALTLPVDYWDYLGWKDTLALPAFSKRQRLYAKERGDGQVYTPQTVVNGASHHVGSDKTAVTKAIPAAPLPVAVTLAGSEAAPEVQIPAAKEGPRAGAIWLLPVARKEQVVIMRGENRGKTITYTHVAREMIRLGDWRGEALALPVPAEAVTKAGADGYVVLLHAEGGKIGRIIGAAASRSLTAPGS